MELSEPSMRVVPNQSPMAGGRPKPGGSWLLWQVAAQKPDGGGAQEKLSPPPTSGPSMAYQATHPQSRLAINNHHHRRRQNHHGRRHQRLSEVWQRGWRPRQWPHHWLLASKPLVGSQFKTKPCLDQNLLINSIYYSLGDDIRLFIWSQNVSLNCNHHHHLVCHKDTSLPRVRGMVNSNEGH